MDQEIEKRSDDLTPNPTPAPAEAAPKPQPPIAAPAAIPFTQPDRATQAQPAAAARPLSGSMRGSTGRDLLMAVLIAMISYVLVGRSSKQDRYI